MPHGLHNVIIRSEIGIQAASFGAEIQIKINRKVTHLVASTSRTRTTKVRQAAKFPNIKIVNQQWLLNSISKWEKEDETPYLVRRLIIFSNYTNGPQVEIHESDRIRKDGFDSSTPSSVRDSDDSDDEGESGDDAGDVFPSSQEDNETESDPEGLIPDDMEEGHSPVDDLKEFNWGEADAELLEFMDGDDDSANDSDASDSSSTSLASRSSHKSKRGVKRIHGETTDDSETDEESRMAKRVKRANARTTGLKTVKTTDSVGSESSLPTPGVTGDEDDVATNGDTEHMNGEMDDDDEAELERELEAAFEDDFGE